MEINLYDCGFCLVMNRQLQRFLAKVHVICRTIWLMTGRTRLHAVSCKISRGEIPQSDASNRCRLISVIPSALSAPRSDKLRKRLRFAKLNLFFLFSGWNRLRTNSCTFQDREDFKGSCSCQNSAYFHKIYLSSLSNLKLNDSDVRRTPEMSVSIKPNHQRRLLSAECFLVFFFAF